MNPSFMDDYLYITPPSNSDVSGKSAPFSTNSTDEENSPSSDNDFSGTVLKYINQMLMEEDMEEKPCMFHDPLALQAAEKSLYEVIGEKYPSSPNQHHVYHSIYNVESPDDNVSAGSFSGYGSIGSYSTGTTNSSDSPWNSVDLVEDKPSAFETSFPANFIFESTSKSSPQSSMKLTNGFTNSGTELVGSSITELLDLNWLSESQSVLQFRRGMEEASKFLPKDNQLIIDMEKNTFFPASNKKVSEVVIKTERDEQGHLPNEPRGRKNHDREDDAGLEDGRSNKQSALYVEENELSDFFDKVLLGREENHTCISSENYRNGRDRKVQKNGNSNGSSGGKTRVKKQGNKKEVIDLRTLLSLCAQAVSSDDRRTANELLRQIRQHSSTSGNGSQRLASCFANALEARLAGTGTHIYTALASKRTSAAAIIKAFQVYISACPFRKLAIIFADHTILHLAEKAETLHIIDFGILYGFQWPALIYRLSKRHGGPPKLRITGIELPQRGFRPAEGVQETGRRLARYCERFNVPFEYNGIAQKWETIKIEDLNIDKNEILVVNSLFRFRHLLDETVVLNSPRDAVLSLIRKMNPSIFIQALYSGSYNAPFFLTRFREALFHYSSLFDVLETNIAHEDSMRSMFEKEFLGREVMNIIACEGSERIERPETYKQSQVRHMRAGFRQLPLDRELMKKLQCKLRGGYHDDFMLDEDGHWMLQGWKGRILYTSSCWIPT
ncbi:Scarecrow-like protein [Quillaja saponaria]|uniref:Scarecrow-like protein n=1 Tax=Quillaja saponaria TaxID=32244 RepID=A0AAD7KXJ1_QUISA|nr:Scarecrow-like protein [Quillaja saponaria]